MSNELDTGVANSSPVSISMGDPLAKPEVKTGEAKGLTLDVVKREKPKEAPQPDPNEDEDEDNLDDNPDGDPPVGDDDDQDGDDGDQEELSEFTPEEADKWDAAYKKDGKLDIQKLGEEWWKNFDPEAGDGGLNEATYDYLASLGLEKSVVKDYEVSIKAKATAERNGLIERAGSEDELNAALAWGRDGGYTQAQLERFNTIMEGQDLSAKEDAVDALMSRVARSKPPKKTPSRPKRDVTNTSKVTSRSTPDTFKSRAEYREAQRAAKTQEQRLEVAKRRKASDF